MLKQTLGWTRPRLRDPQAADTWTWLVITARTQLRLAREQVEDLRRPWERPTAPSQLTPARVRRGFRNIRGYLPLPGRCAETLTTGPRTPARLAQPTPRHHPERRQDRQTRPNHHRAPHPTDRLKNKLRVD